jgi:hypothetical protein
VELNRQFINEMAIVRFSGGFGTELDIQDNIVVKKQYSDGIIKQMAK